MIKKIVLFFAFVAIAYTTQAQKVIDKMVKQTCDCIETIDINGDAKYLDTSFANCFGESLIKNRAELSKKYKMEFGEELLNKIQPVFVNELITKCDKALQIGAKIAESKEDEPEDETQDIVSVPKKKVTLDPSIAPPTKQQCLDLHTGTFQYIKDGILDTTKTVEFTKDNVLDYDANGKLITTSTIEWKTDCAYVSTMVKTESEELKKFAKEKTKIEAMIVQIQGDIITYDVKVFGLQTLYQLKRIK